MDSHEQGKPNRKERRLSLQRPNPSGSPQVSSPPLTDSPKKPDYGLFLGIIGLAGMLFIFALQSNGVVELNWIISAVIYAFAAALIVASVLLHAVPHLGPRKRWSIGVATLFLATGIGAYGTFKEYAKEHPTPEAAQAAPLVTVEGYVSSLAPYADGTKFAGITWHPNEVDVRADIRTGSTDIQNLDFTILMDTEIMGIGQATAIPGCTMFPAGNVEAMGATLGTNTGKRVAIPLSREMAVAPTYRVQCQNVFANTVISFSIASVYGNPGPPRAGKNFSVWQPPKFLSIKGTYETPEGVASTPHSINYSTDFKNH